MDGAVAGEGVDAPAQPHAEADGVGGVADADLFLEPRRQIHQRDGPVEHQVDGFAKTGLSYSLVHAPLPGPCRVRASLDEGACKIMSLSAGRASVPGRAARAEGPRRRPG